MHIFLKNVHQCFHREGHVGVARLLLEAGADVETPDNYGQSPFFMACWKGHAVVAALLLEYDANKDCRTKTGITPLFQVRPHPLDTPTPYVGGLHCVWYYVYCSSWLSDVSIDSTKECMNHTLVFLHVM